MSTRDSQNTESGPNELSKTAESTESNSFRDVLIVLSDDGDSNDILAQQSGLYDEAHVYGDFFFGRGEGRYSNVNLMNSDLEKMQKVWGENNSVTLAVDQDFDSQNLPDTYDVQDLEQYADNVIYIE